MVQSTSCVQQRQQSHGYERDTRTYPPESFAIPCFAFIPDAVVRIG